MLEKKVCFDLFFLFTNNIGLSRDVDSNREHNTTQIVAPLSRRDDGDGVARYDALSCLPFSVEYPHSALMITALIWFDLILAIAHKTS